MPYRIALIGSPNWLHSPNVRRLAQTSAISRVDTSEKPDLANADVVLVQMRKTAKPQLSQWLGGSPKHWLAVARRPDEPTFQACVKAQAWGCIEETSSPAEYLSAIVDAARGRLVYPTHILDRIRSIGGQLNLISSREQLCTALKRNQREFLKLLASGHSLQSSTKTLRIPPDRVRQFIAQLHSATNTSSTAEMIDFANETTLTHSPTDTPPHKQQKRITQPKKPKAAT